MTLSPITPCQGTSKHIERVFFDRIPYETCVTAISEHCTNPGERYTGDLDVGFWGMRCIPWGLLAPLFPNQLYIGNFPDSTWGDAGAKCRYVHTLGVYYWVVQWIP